MEKTKLQELIVDVIAQVMDELMGTRSATTADAPVCDNDKKDPVADDGEIADLSAVDFSKILATPNPANGDAFLKLKERSTVRLGTWRAGPRYRTETYLRLRADHAKAMDAVFEDVPEDLIHKLKLFPVTTRCASKDDYLTRPDLGRQFDDETAKLIQANCIAEPDVQLIVSDGLSSTSITQNVEDVLPALLQGLEMRKIKVGTPIYVKYGRVGCMDAITEMLRAKVTVILIGERPGLGTSESLSAYMTYGGYVGIAEAAGLSYRTFIVAGRIRLRPVLIFQIWLSECSKRKNPVLI